MKMFILRLAAIYKPYKQIILIIFAFIITMQTLILVSPYLYGMIIDALNEQKPMKYVLLLAAVAFIIQITAGVILTYFRQTYEVNRLSFEMPRHLGGKTLKKMFGYSVGQHNSQNSGVKQSIISDGEQALTSLAYLLFYEVIPLTLSVTLTIGVLLYLSTVLGLIVLISTVIFIGTTVYLNNKFEEPLEVFEELRHDAVKTHTEILRNGSLIQLNAQEKRSINDYDKALVKLGNFGKDLWSRYFLLSSSQGMITTIAKWVVLSTGILFVYNGNFTLGYLVTFLAWSSHIFDALGGVGEIHKKVMEYYVTVKKYFAMLDVKPAIIEIDNPVQPTHFDGKVTFKNVSFSYPARSYVQSNEVRSSKQNATIKTLSNINFTIKSGQKVALVGHSSAGKSTIIHMLLRSYDPDQGQIYIDKHDLRLLGLKCYRGIVGYVEQDVTLFDNTLRYNVAFGLNSRSEDVSDSDLIVAMNLAGIGYLPGDLEQGFDTIIGERGIQISGGERQRVGIARALMKDPRILIFDEATSSLDTETEFLIQESIDKASKGRTTIIIAHRLYTIRDADMIFVMDKGKIIGKGTHDELMDSCEKYKTLVNKQVVIA